MWRWVAAKCVRLFHLLIVIFLAFGWALPWPIAWWLHVILTIVTRVHWRFNNRTCILTSWEQQLLQNEQTEEHEEGWIIKEIAESLTGRRPSTIARGMVGECFESCTENFPASANAQITPA